MCVLDKILSLLDKQGKTQKELADFLGVKKNCVTDWKSGKSRSFEKYIYQIAVFLNVSVDYLLGKEKSPSADAEELDGIDKLIIDTIKPLSDDDKKRVLAMIQIFISKKE